MARTSFDNDFILAIRALRDSCPQEYSESWEWIAAKWVLESGWGEDDLPKTFYNYGGMQYRKCHKGIGVCRFYTDWNSKKGWYLKLDSPEDYYKAYFAFINRYRYWGHKEYKGQQLIKFLVQKGYCEEKPFSKPYDEKVKDIKEGPSFRNLIQKVNEDLHKVSESHQEDIGKIPDWLDLS